MWRRSTELASKLAWVRRGNTSELGPRNHQNKAAFNLPVVDCCLCDKGDGVETDPLPKNDVICHIVGLHLWLHLDVENLQSLAGFQRDHFRGRVHYGWIGRNRSPRKEEHISNVSACIASVIFSTFFRHFEANTCRNFELEEDFCWVRLKICWVRSRFCPHFARFPIVLLKIAEILS